MARRIHAPIFPILILAGVGLGQTPPPAAGNARIYVLLKQRVAEPGDARDAFTQRMAGLGAINLQFVTGANAARCEAPVAAQAAIGADVDVAGVLPMDTAPPATQPAASPPATTAPATQPPPSGPILSTPPYLPSQQTIPVSGGIPMGGGMSTGMSMLTDFAGNMIVKLLTPGSSCKIRLAGAPLAIPSTGGSGAFEVKASGNCAWQAVSTADWLQVKSEVNSAGTVAVVYTAARNPGGHRQAVVVIQPVAGLALKGHTVTVVGQQ